MFKHKYLQDLKERMIEAYQKGLFLNFSLFIFFLSFSPFKIGVLSFCSSLSEIVWSLDEVISLIQIIT